MNRLSLGKYIAEIEIDLADEMLHGRIINVPDVLRFEGSNVFELKSSFVQTISDYEQVLPKNEFSEPPKIEDIKIVETDIVRGMPVNDRFLIFSRWSKLIAAIEYDNINKAVAIEKIAAALRSNAGIDPTFRAYVADMMSPTTESDLMPRWRFAKVTARRRGKPTTNMNIEQALAVGHKLRTDMNNKQKRSKEEVYAELGEFDDNKPHRSERIGVKKYASVDRKTFITSEKALKRVKSVIDRYQSRIFEPAELDGLMMSNWEGVDNEPDGA